MNDLTIFGLEKLEDRLLLAVNVTQNGSTLNIVGDENYETIEVHNDGGGIRVIVDYDGDEVVDDTLYYYGVRNINIRTKGGNDYIYISDLDLDGNLSIDTGSGNDEVQIDLTSSYFGSYYGDVSIGGNVSIKTGDGTDVAWFAEGSIGKNLTINSGADYDEVYLFSGFYGAYDLTVNGSTKITTGDGDDHVYITAYNGTDVDLQALTISTGDGEDYVRFYTEVDDSDVDVGNTKIDTGDGDDEVYIFGYEDGDEVDFNGAVQIKTGSGDDYVHIVGYADFFGNATFDGGADVDTIDWDDGSFYGDLKIKKFEIIL